MKTFIKFFTFSTILFFSVQSFSQQVYNVQRGQRGYIPPPKYEASAYITTLDVYEELNVVLPMCVASFSLDEFETQILKGMLLKKLESYNAVVSNTDLSKEARQDKLKQLEELELTTQGISDFSFLESMPNLKEIITYHVPVTSLKGISEAPNLETLEINLGKLAKIDNLDRNTQLKSLILNDHQITKMSGLDNLKKLNVLDLTNNNITKIEGLDNNLCLEKLWLAANPVKTFENIFHLPLLGEMGLNKTKISEFPNWKNLNHLHRLSVDKGQLNKELFTPGYFYSFVPIKDFDMQMRQAKPITDKERKQYNCI